MPRRAIRAPRRQDGRKCCPYPVHSLPHLHLAGAGALCWSPGELHPGLHLRGWPQTRPRGNSHNSKHSHRSRRMALPRALFWGLSILAVSFSSSPRDGHQRWHPLHWYPRHTLLAVKLHARGTNLTPPSFQVCSSVAFSDRHPSPQLLHLPETLSPVKPPPPSPSPGPTSYLLSPGL